MRPRPLKSGSTSQLPKSLKNWQKMSLDLSWWVSFLKQGRCWFWKKKNSDKVGNNMQKATSCPRTHRLPTAVPSRLVNVTAVVSLCELQRMVGEKGQKQWWEVKGRSNGIQLSHVKRERESFWAEVSRWDPVPADSTSAWSRETEGKHTVNLTLSSGSRIIFTGGSGMGGGGSVRAATADCAD